MTTDILEFTVCAVQLVLFFIGVYYLGIALFSLAVFRREKKSSEKHRFALITAAHNEENVIGELVESLKNIDYPRDKFEIFVVADNCTDNTALVAKEAGARVFERCDTSKRGKGFALEFVFEKLFKNDEQFEYFCVFDADNIVKPDFLIHMNDKINEGFRAVQGYLDSKNPTASWLTFSYSLWYWINNRVAQLSRSNLDFGCRLGGTGFAVEAKLIKEYGWGATCLAEDTEFTLKLALDNVKVGWCHEAVVYDEKPLGMETSVNQRKRWVQGLADVASHYVRPLMKKGFSERSAFPFHMLMNFWGDCLYPFTAVFFAAVLLVSVFGSEKSVLCTLLCGMWRGGVNCAVLCALVFGNVFVALASLYSDRKLDRNILKNLPGFAVYIFSWIPIGIAGVLKKNDREWFHTPHTPKNGGDGTNPTEKV